ncbi:MAG: hypothetical protein KDA31_07715 [Phycisphaerales bacterium]|nr:hypothetical protein [Phycisphaerales bacterium]MCB9836730.1 hypothetical protein [Phycisphaera sp.]
MQHHLSVLLLSPVLLTSSTYCQTGVFLPVAVSDSSAPGIEPSAEFGNFSQLSINESGQVTFSSTLNASFDATAYWARLDGSNVELIVRRGTPLPGIEPGVSLGNVIGPLTINDHGHLALSTLLIGPGIGSRNDKVVFSSANGSGLERLIREGDQAPGLDIGVTIFDIFHGNYLNNSGHSAFAAIVSGTGVTSGNNSVLFSSAVGNVIEPIAREGEHAHGLASNVIYRDFDTPLLNNASQIAVLATVDGLATNADNDTVIMAPAGNDYLTAIVRENSPAHGLPAGVRYGAFDNIHFNDNGFVSYTSTVRGSGLTAQNNGALFATLGGNGPSLMVRRGDQAPDAEIGVIFNNFAGTPQLTNADQLLFRASLTGSNVDITNDGGIYRVQSDGVVSQIAREGENVPGLSDQFVFTSFNQFGLEGNRSGEIVFWAGFTDGQSSFDGIFYASESRQLWPLLMTGEMLDVDTDPVGTAYRIVEWIHPEIQFTDSGRIAAIVHFTDGTSGVYSAIIPAPGSMTGLAISVHIGLRRQRRRTP